MGNRWSSGVGTDGRAGRITIMALQMPCWKVAGSNHWQFFKYRMWAPYGLFGSDLGFSSSFRTIGKSSLNVQLHKNVCLLSFPFII